MSVQKIGDHIRREEDPRLLRGRGRYVDDVRLPREARGYVLRSPSAHARIQAIELTRYAAVDDCGVVLNPLLAEGQIQGGIVQGIGQVLMENIVYDESGQLLSGSFQDYCMPRANDFCHFDLGNNESPTDRNPLGVKGVGEAGTLGASPAVINAVNDALARIGAPAVEMPATSEKVWRAIRAANGNNRSA